jgi:hypothetical protein
MTPFKQIAAAATIAAAGLGLAASIAFAATVNGSGKSVTQERQATGFTGLALAVPAVVDIVQGGAEGLSITADDNIAPEIETVVEKGVLQIRWRTRNFDVRQATRIRIALNAKTLESIAIAGSGDVNAPAVTASKFAVNISGSGDVKLGGRADSIKVSIAGSGDVNAGKFDTQSASIRIAGSGDAVVWARKSLEAQVAGSGDIRYYGDPTVAKRIAGSGSVRRAGDAPG